MRIGRGATLAAVIGAQLAACASARPPAGASGEPPASGSAVAIREDLQGHFLALIGPKVQDAPPYLDTLGTNFSCLRSFVDRRSGKTAHQLYVVASYEFNHDWNAAHDSAGSTLKFVPISRLPIACDNKHDCSYAEEFAAKLSENELSQNPHGFTVTFSGHTGDTQTIAVSADQIAAQLAALAKLQKSATPASAAATQ